MTQEATKTERQAALRKAFAGKQKGSRPWLWLDDIRRNPAAIVAWIESLRQDYRASKNVRDRAEIAKQGERLQQLHIAVAGRRY